MTSPAITRTIEREGYQLHARADGPAGAPVVLFSNSLGATLHSWEPQATLLSERFLVLRYDHRGHGGSSAPVGDYTMSELAHDALSVLDAFDVARAHVCGLSIGGMVGQWLAIEAPARIDRLVLCNTASRIGTHEAWAARIALVREQGLAPLVEPTLERWFTADLRARDPALLDRVRASLLRVAVDGYAGCCAALRDTDLTPDLDRIERPTLVIGGSFDPATPPADTAALAGRIRGASHRELAAAHVSNLEAVEAFNDALTTHLVSVRIDPQRP